MVIVKLFVLHKYTIKMKEIEYIKYNIHKIHNVHKILKIYVLSKYSIFHTT